MSLNRWTKALKTVVPGTIEATTLPPLAVGKRPNLSHLPRDLIPYSCYIEIDEEDLHMLVVPPAFQGILRDWIKIPLPCCVAISTRRWCDEWV
jgi:hypothetical protein